MLALKVAKNPDLNYLMNKLYYPSGMASLIYRTRQNTGKDLCY